MVECVTSRLRYLIKLFFLNLCVIGQQTLLIQVNIYFIMKII